MNDILKKRQIPFTQIPNELICDYSLSCKAKAIYCYLASRPSDWIFYTEEIQNNFKEGRDAIAEAIKELVSSGWISKQQIKINGKFSHNEYELFYSATKGKTVDGKTVDGKTVDGKTVDGKTVDGKTDTNNTDITNTECTNTYYTNTDIKKTIQKKKIELVNEQEEQFDIFWQNYPNKKSKLAAYKAFLKAIKKTDLETLLRAIQAHKMTKSWTDKNGQFVPMPVTWLNQERWADELNINDVDDLTYINLVLGEN